MRFRSQFVRVAGLGCVVLLAGCHKRVRVATPPLPLPTLPAEPMPTNMPTPPAEVPAPTPPTAAAPAAPAPTPAPAPRAARRPVAPAAKPAAPAPAPQPGLGNLSEGGAGNNPGDLRAQTQAMLAEIDKRVKDLSADVKQQKRQALAQVQQFEQQARDALNHGDPAGANNLATKGKLLLDDTLK